ncbi:hypothetical protein L2E82_22229 [Cichorium intybus]|uniref:Uncharacterized protein n=1 Tax=Cichorium intybus TaxID=13427 RepID=A0ACB9DXL6_CICIN|nr:hypothetical protein L2E82_22229 [Cichorium intybus]
MNFLNEGQVTWRNWFESMNLWVGQDFSYGRIAWIKIEGVPLHIWDGPVFYQIGESFGKIAMPSESSWMDDDISAGYACILVQSNAKIEDEILITWFKKCYKIRVSEESRSWYPIMDQESDDQSVGNDLEKFLDGSINEELENEEMEEEEGEFRPENFEDHLDGDWNASAVANSDEKSGEKKEGVNPRLESLNRKSHDGESESPRFDSANPNLDDFGCAESRLGAGPGTMGLDNSNRDSKHTDPSPNILVESDGSKYAYPNHNKEDVSN